MHNLSRCKVRVLQKTGKLRQVNDSAIPSSYCPISWTIRYVYKRFKHIVFLLISGKFRAFEPHPSLLFHPPGAVCTTSGIKTATRHLMSVQFVCMDV